MADYTVTINLYDHKRGDEWIGIAGIGPVVFNDATPAGALVRVRMQFRKDGGTTFRLDSDSEADRDAPIVITDPDTWEANIPPVPNFLDQAGDWSWDMEFWEAGKSAPMTFYKGVLTVHDDITR